MHWLALDQIVKRFNTVQVLHGVSFGVDRGSVLGLIGENGSGKSTCMNILGGVTPATSGAMTIDGQPYRPATPRDATDVGIAFIHQELNLFTNLSIEENIFIDDFPKRSKWLPLLDRSEMRRRAGDLLEMIGLERPATARVNQLSQGERQMVEIAKGLRSDAKLMIFDEPTTSLTKQECDRLFQIIERLRSGGLAIIYISHILDDVLRLADEIVVLRDGAVASINRSESTSHDELVQQMVGREISQLYPSRSRPAESDPGLAVRSLNLAGFVKNIDLQVDAGEIVGLAGMMGSGRTELARMLFGLDDFDSGTISVDGQELTKLSPAACAEAGMAFVTEDRRDEGLFLDARIRTNVASASLDDYAVGKRRFVSLGLIQTSRLKADADEAAASSGLAHESPWGKLVRNLSGGNQQKVVLAKWMMRRPRVLILDEPTRGVDIGAKHEIYESIARLAAAGTAILMISSEMEELTGMCDRIAVMQRGEIVAEFEGPEYDDESLMRAAIWTREEAQT